MRDETEIGGSGRQFLSTHWSHVFDARQGAVPERRAALERLTQTYWKPIYFLIRRRGHPVETAKDLTQGFFAAFLERDFLQYVDQGRGRFRFFLRVTLDHYLADEHDRASAEKRGGGRALVPLDFAEAEEEVREGGASDEDPDRYFRRKWAIAVMKEALEAVRKGYIATNRAGEFDLLLPYVTGGADEGRASGAARLGISETDFDNRLRRVRKLYRDAILGEIRSGTESETDAQEELRDLFSSLGP